MPCGVFFFQVRFYPFTAVFSIRGITEVKRGKLRNLAKGDNNSLKHKKLNSSDLTLVLPDCLS